jgi:WD40 repeat protein
MKIATSGEDGTLRVWDATNGTQLISLPAQRDWEHLPAFSPDGQVLAGINPEGDVTIWDIESGDDIVTFSNDGPALSTVTFSPDGSRLAAGGLGGKAYIWDLIRDQLVATINNDEGLIINDLVFSPEGDYIFSYDWLGWT